MYVKINPEEISQPTVVNINRPKAPNKFVLFIKDWYPLLVVTLIVVIAATTASAYILNSNTKKSNGSYAVETLNSNQNSNTSYTPKTVYLESPINGELLSEDTYKDLSQRKVLAVMIENLAGANGARPQAGLQDADIVYETLAEGNITRFMGIFWNKKDDIKLMPIRSARKYFIDWTMEYKDPLYMHIGQADSTNENTDALGALQKYNIKDLTNFNNSFSRDKTCETSRAVEHCAYTDTDRLWSMAKNKGWTGVGEQTTFTYKEDNVADPEAKVTRDATNIRIDFLEDFANYGAAWKYDKNTNTYLRYQGTTPHVDQKTNQQLSTKTLVIQKTSIQEIGNDNPAGEPVKYHKSIKTVGTGDAWIIQDGKAVEATWKKDDLTSRTKYYDRVTGKELSLDRGKMWITVTGNSPIIN